MPARKKPASQRADNRRQRAGLKLVKPPAGVAKQSATPPPPDGLTDEAKQLWETYWTSEVAAAFEQVDQAVLERWIWAFDEWVKCSAMFREMRLVAGSTGQPVLNPIAKWIASRESVMAQCEQQLGAGALSRHRLGITIGQAKMTAEQLNRMVPDGNHDQDEEAVDAEEAEILEEFELGP